ncbi:MAG: transcriptional regulator NrdR [Selenomonadaceae bacterium]|nr:transcriptional regulator NrdR [Selenomonadaceae bacterium]
MRCPYCRQADSRVIDSRSIEDDRGIKRRRECSNCGRRFTTYEMVEQLPLMVVKHNGTKQVFERNKLLNGLIRSCEKRGISLESIMTLAQEIEKNIRHEYDLEVPSSAIGEMALNGLKDFDQVAYIRFASVYRKFSDINGFKSELEILNK